MKKRDVKIDFVLAILVVILTLFGVVMVYDTSVVVAYEEWGDKFFLFKNQFLWAGIGLLTAFLLSKFDYHRLQKLALPLLVTSIILLFLVLIPGVSAETYGAKRRISLPLSLPILQHINLQPSELAKLSLIIYLASWLSQEVKSHKESLSFRRKRIDFLKSKTSQLSPFLALTGLVMGLIILEPDLGTALIVGATTFLIYYLSGVSLLEIGLISLVLILGATVFALTSPYRYNRLLSFFNASQDKLGISYHVNQLLITLGSGGLFGLGLGHSRQKYQYLPESFSDSIFAIIGEEIGFLGALFVVILLFFIILKGFEIARRAPDKLGQLLAGGITSLIGIQVVINLASNLALIPLTGVPLPFISYGGSSLTILLTGVGILLNISKQSK